MIVEAPGNPFEDLRPLVEEARAVLSESFAWPGDTDRLRGR